MIDNLQMIDNLLCVFVYGWLGVFPALLAFYRGYAPLAILIPTVTATSEVLVPGKGLALLLSLVMYVGLLFDRPLLRWARRGWRASWEVIKQGRGDTWASEVGPLSALLLPGLAVIALIAHISPWPKGLLTTLDRLPLLVAPEVALCLTLAAGWLLASLTYRSRQPEHRSTFHRAPNSFDAGASLPR